jgi:hypothetical protein
MTTRRIFRESAVRRYNERLERIELPRYVTLPWRRLTWIGGGLLLLLAMLLSIAQLPVYATGPGVVIYDEAGGAAVAALLPTEAAAHLRQGQIAQVQLAAEVGGDVVEGAVTAVEPRPLSPVAVRQRYELDAAAGALVEGPVTVALLSFDRPAEQWTGSVTEVRIAVGSHSVLALLLGSGRFFENELNGAESE